MSLVDRLLLQVLAISFGSLWAHAMRSAICLIVESHTKISTLHNFTTSQPFPHTSYVGGRGSSKRLSYQAPSWQPDKLQAEKQRLIHE